MTNGHSDPEAALYKDLAKIEEFRKEVRSLKTQLGRLAGRVKQLEVMDFQNQLNSLDERIKKTSDELTAIKKQQAKGLLETHRIIAALEINSASNSFWDIIHFQLSDNSNLRTQLVADASTAKSQVMTSEKPYDIVTEFKHKWTKRVRELGAEGIEF